MPPLAETRVIHKLLITQTLLITLPGIQNWCQKVSDGKSDDKDVIDLIEVSAPARELRK